MANLKKFLILLFVCISSTVLMSCGNNDDGVSNSQDIIDVINKSDFVGSWRTIDATETYYLVLRSNGTGKLIEEVTETPEIVEKTLIWYHKDRILTLLFSEHPENFYVSELTKNVMTLIDNENDTVTFSRVNSSAVPGDSEITDDTDNPDKPDNPDNPDDPDDPDDPDNSGTSSDTGIKTGSAQPRAYSATITGVYIGNKLPTTLGFEYSYDNSFPSKQTGGYSISGKFGGFEFEATGLVDQIKVYYRVYAIVDGNCIYGETKSFETLPGTYSIDGKTYNFIKVTGLTTGSFSMMQTELPPNAEIKIDGKSIGCWSADYSSTYVTKGATREFFDKFTNAAVVPRYPTPQEWLYAAAGGSKSNGYIYCGSNDIDEVAWFAENSNNHVRKPAQKKSNELDFYDMSGNYAEYCAVYDEDQLEDTREKYIKGFIRTIKNVPALYFDTSWNAKGGAYGGYWGAIASKCQVNSSVVDNTPANTNHFNGDIYTARLVYSRPD